MRIRCWNYDNCSKAENKQISTQKPCCSRTCEVLLKLSTNFGNKKEMYKILGDFVLENGGNLQQSSSVSNSSKVTSLVWDMDKKGTGIIISDGGATVFLREQSYVFRTVVAKQGFT